VRGGSSEKGADSVGAMRGRCSEGTAVRGGCSEGMVQGGCSEGVVRGQRECSEGAVRVCEGAERVQRGGSKDASAESVRVQRGCSEGRVQ